MAHLPARVLVPAGEGASLDDLIRERAFGPRGHQDFVHNFTVRKLRTPVDDTLYSLHASRTQLLPHQFKPLIRFLDSIHRRYLIADEVGLGKTIEAGIILSELRARRSLGGVLILCPNHLREKWRSELQIRFDEPFTIVGRRAELMQHLDEIDRDGSDNKRLIVGHKTLAYRMLRERVEEGAPSFDLVVVDEAHYFRNSETLLRQILGEISDAANQLLLLTATPIQTAADNLLSLLRLLDASAFRSATLFQARLEVNRFLVLAERSLRSASSQPADLRASALLRIDSSTRSTSGPPLSSASTMTGASRHWSRNSPG